MKKISEIDNGSFENYNIYIEECKTKAYVEVYGEQ